MNSLVVIIIIVAVVLLFFYAGYRKERMLLNEYADSLVKNYGKKNTRKYSTDELKSIKGYSDYYHKDFYIDEITWNDLDMWQIYKSVNYCQSSAGDEYLYYMLKNPALNENEWDELEAKIEQFQNSEKERRTIQLCLHLMGRTGKYSLNNYLECITSANTEPVIKDIVIDVLYLVAVVMCFINVIAGLLLLLAVMVFNLSSYFKKKKVIEQYIVCFKYLFRILKNSNVILKTDSQIIKDEKEVLAECISELNNFSRFSSIVVGDIGNGPAGIVLDYIKMLTHIDLIKFNSMLEEVKRHKDCIIKMAETIGKIDCYIAIGEFRTSLDYYGVPAINDCYNSYKIIDGYHPLISQPVPNSIDEKGSVLLTGSNASGKSTFLKMIAINCILAQSIHTVCAKEYCAPYFRVYSSLSLKDSILKGDSYYMVEIKSIKRIIDATKDKGRVLGFVDEVLRGTNTTERIAASSAILKSLNSENVTVFAATHDLELTGILEGEYANYHFEEEISDNDIHFRYVLAEGKAVSRNAIKLLDILGYDKNIICEAEKKVKVFEQTGNWT